MYLCKTDVKMQPRFSGAVKKIRFNKSRSIARLLRGRGETVESRRRLCGVIYRLGANNPRIGETDININIINVARESGLNLA